jgi:hypothetical protein
MAAIMPHSGRLALSAVSAPEGPLQIWGGPQSLADAGGGFAPFISIWLVDVTANPLAPAFYVMTGGALSAIAILSMKEYLDVPLE